MIVDEELLGMIETSWQTIAFQEQRIIDIRDGYSHEEQIDRRLDRCAGFLGEAAIELGKAVKLLRGE